MIRLERIRCRPSLGRRMTPDVSIDKKWTTLGVALSHLGSRGIGIRNERLVRKRSKVCVGHVWFDMRLRAMRHAHLERDTGRRATRNSARRKRAVT